MLLDSEKLDEEIDPADPRTQRVAFQDSVSTGGHIDSRTSYLHRTSSRDLFQGDRSRARSISGVSIEFRTLSYEVSAAASKEDSNRPDIKGSSDKYHFGNLVYHELSCEDVCRDLNVSSAAGLSTICAAARLEKDGKNTLARTRQNYLKKGFMYVFGGFCSVLWVAVIIYFICWRPLGDPDPAAYNLGLAILVLIVIFLQASFSAFQDWSTARTMNAILDLLPADALVVRDGEFKSVASSDIVVGDIVKVSIGNKVPADVRLLSTSGDVRFDRSIFSGENIEVEGAVTMTDTNFLETRNIAFMGAVVTNGSAVGVVVLTGGNTVMGRIAKATASVKKQPTLIQREINRFIIIIVCLTIVLALAILLTWAGWLRVKHHEFMNVAAVLDDVMGCVVAFIPEGIPVAVALTLLVIANRMKATNILAKGLSTVETLGCVDVICSDKTGTLTENKMVVTTVGFLDKQLLADKTIQQLKSREPGPLNVLWRATALCNDAVFDSTDTTVPVAERKVQGNATDGAVLKYVELSGEGSSQTFQTEQPRVFQIPFNSKNKWMLTLHYDKESAREAGDSPSYLLLAKGAPDVLLPFCTSWWSYEENCVKPFNPAIKNMFFAMQEKLSRAGQRVILLCERTIRTHQAVGSNAFSDEIQETGMSDLTIIGALGITDPPRSETRSTVEACRRAAVRFFMVTGDFGLTAAAIAHDVGIFTGTAEPDTFATIRDEHDIRIASGTTTLHKEEDDISRLLLDGPSIAKLQDDDWNIVCAYDEIVFARTTPEQKLRIVNEFKARDHIVAVTGDGVNDAPALRAANVGIAVASGSNVALEASDLVLMAKFDSIVDAIRLGRQVFQNLQKVIAYLLSAGSWSEIWPIIMNVWFGVPLPLSSFLMIIICVFTDLFCSLSLIMEKEEFDLLELPPRNHKRDHLINAKIYAQSYLFIGSMEAVAAHCMFFFYYYKHAGIPFHALIFAFEKYSDGFYGYTQDQLSHFNIVGQSVYFVTLVIMQWGSLLSVRNKRLSILQADPIRRQRRNVWLWLGIIVSFAIVVFVTEEPGLQRIFGTASVPIEFWLIPLPLALGVLVMDEVRKLMVRAWPKGPLAKIAW